MYKIEIIYRVITIVFTILTLILLPYSIHSMYYAYFKTKDERQKCIVLRSMAYSFTILLCYFSIEYIIEMAKSCRVTRQTINAIENNKYDPTLQLAFALAEALKTTVDELFIK